MVGNVVAGIVVIVGFIVGIAIIGLSFSFPPVEGLVFFVGILVVTGSIGLPLAVLGRVDQARQ